ncbi:NEDD4-binding protein 2-like isoform X1 [Acropora millepora]|uniref:NEDD4-binding protein 2-like isoform X1 n=1 Tax=Acropora millepora TaxID=45264 RepID=UPI001CF58B3B|nr:NEDD4-binding protein 2-like isoform X1 [Acropora millepora]
MPRRKNQGQTMSTLDTYRPEDMSETSKGDLKWRETTSKQLQSMFSGAIDPDVIQLVLSESNFSVNDAIEKLFVLSGTEENQQEKPQTGTLLSSSSSQLLRENSGNKSTHELEQRAIFHPGKKESLADSSNYGSCPEFQATPGPLLNSKNGCQYKVHGNVQYPDAMPSTSPCSESNSIETDSPLQTTSFLHKLSSSGLPNFPDDVSQQFTLLQGEPATSNNVQQRLLQGDTKGKEMLRNSNNKTPNDEITQNSFHIVRPLETAHVIENHELKRNVDWQSQGMNPLPNKGLEHTENELRKTRINSGNVETTAREISNSKEESPERENHLQRELSSLNEVECKTKTSRQNVRSATGSCKPPLQSPVYSAYQLPNCGSFARGSFVHPPAIQRQFQPFLPSHRHGHAIQGQQRAGFVPVLQSSWQQGSPGFLRAELVPQECNRGQSDLVSLSYLPPFVFAGGANPAAAVKGIRPASPAIRVPFVPTIHQKLLIMIRGLPGSGKSTLAQKLKGAHGIVLSTDDYFYRNKHYKFDATALGEAHEWNQRRAKKALEKQISPVIIDNTNTQCWEMRPYALMGTRLGYHIKIMEPDNSWKWNVKELARRNQHGVGAETIAKMKERYEHNVSVEKVLNCERKVEEEKGENEFETSKGTGPYNGYPSSTSPRSFTERGSEKTFLREEEAASNFNTRKRLKGFHKDENRDAFKAGKSVGIQNDADQEKVKESSKYEESEVNCGSDAESLIEEFVKNETNASRNPQRVPKARAGRTPDDRLLLSSKLPSAISADSIMSKQQEESPFNNILLEQVLVKQSDTSSLSHSVRTVDGGDEDLLEEAASPLLSRSSISGKETAVSSEGDAPVFSVPFGDAHRSVCDLSTDVVLNRILSENSTCESEKEASSLARVCKVDADVTSIRSVSQNKRLHDNEELATPPPLSLILASASRTKPKRRETISTNSKDQLAGERNFFEENTAQQYKDPEAEEKSEQISEFSDLYELTQREFETSRKQEQKTSAGDASGQILTDASKPVSSGDSDSVVPALVEFLKTCFPDVDEDLMNSLLSANGGDVLKVVEELLADDGNLPAFSDDIFVSTEQPSTSGAMSPFSDTRRISVSEQSSITEKLDSRKPTDDVVSIVQHSCGSPAKSSPERPTRVEHANAPSLSPKPPSPAQSPGTFQLALEPAVALHLIEVFGQFAGVDFQESINPEDLIIDVDNTLAKQLYKKWEKTVQVRKGISTSKNDCSPRTFRDPTDADFGQKLGSAQASPASHRSSSRASIRPQTGSFKEIMDEELALELSRKANVQRVKDEDMSVKLNRKKLFGMFPGVDPVALEEVFQANSYALVPSVEAVRASCNLSGQEVPNIVVASEFQKPVINKPEVKRKKDVEDRSWLGLYLDDSSRSDAADGSFQNFEAPTYLDFRAEAFQHHKQRDELFKKAALAFSNKQGDLAQVYAEQGRFHSQKVKEANERAAALILDQTNVGRDENTIDLHGLHVSEAIEALRNFLSEKSDPTCSPSKRGGKVISVITGRGNNSRGGKARIKPAILEYLKESNYRYSEPRPGLVNVHF